MTLLIFFNFMELSGKFQSSHKEEKSRSPHFKFIEDLRIKSSDKDQNYSFFAQGIEADSEKNIYVMDSTDFRVLKFDMEGKFLQTIGRRGQGPGEFEAPSSMIIDNQDNLYIQDVVRMALVVFNRRGEFVQNIQGTGILYYKSKYMIGPDLQIICGYQPLSSIEEGDLYKISKFDRDLNHSFDIYERKGVIFTYRIRTGGGILSVDAPRYTPGVVWTMNPEGRFYVGYNDSYKIKILSYTGELIKEISRKHKPERIPENEKRQIMEGLEKRFKNIPRQIRIPKEKPAFRRFYVVESCLFVLKKRIDTDYYFDVFDKDGTYMEEAILDFLPLVNKNGCVYTVRFMFEGEVDANNITDTEIVRYKVSKNIP